MNDINEVNDYIDLREVFSILWRSKLTIITITAVFAITSVALSLWIPNKYSSDAILAPVANDDSTGLGALSGQLSGLASIAGINVGSGAKVDKVTMALEVVFSREFILNFVDKYSLAVPLLASSSWDKSTKKLNIDPEIYDSKKNAWLLKPNPISNKNPSDDDIVRAFKKSVKINEDKKSSMYRISVEHYSPHLAQKWLKLIIEEINNEMRQRDLLEFSRSVKFLNGQIESTRVSEMKTILYQLVEEQTKKMMVANVRDEYIFSVVDSPVLPERKSSPNRPVICLIGFSVGLIVSLIFVFFRYQVQTYRHQRIS